MLTDFHNSLTARLSGKFVTNAYLNIPPHLKCCVATLPCEISIFKNRHAQVVIEAKCRVRLSHSKKTVLQICLVKCSLFYSLTKRCSHQPYQKSNYRLYTTVLTKKKTLQHAQQSVSHRWRQSVSQ